LGIEFISLTEGIDTSTPVGKMVFTILGSVAEPERSLIAERVKAALRNARAKGKRLGRPQIYLDVVRMAGLRREGRSWRKIARVMGASAKTCRRTWQSSPLSKSTRDAEKTSANRNSETDESTATESGSAGG
jgi:DNA invertase Pin-like site-specific DNA recombinase